MKILIPGRKRQDPQKLARMTELERLFRELEMAERDARKRGKEAREGGEDVKFYQTASGTDNASYLNSTRNEASDNDSISSISTTDTMDNNIGAGRTLDNIFFQPAGRGMEQLLAYIAFLWRGSTVEHPGRPPSPADDRSSKISHSTTSTATDNIGTGRVLDKYVYQVVGKMIEQCAGRIAMSHFLSSMAIARRILEVWKDVQIENPIISYDTKMRVPEFLAGIDEKAKVTMARLSKIESGAFIIAGVSEILRRLT